MFNFCRCTTGPKIELSQANLQSRRNLDNLQINTVYETKAPKLLMIKKPCRDRYESQEIPDLDKLPVLYKKDFVGKPFLMAPGRKDSERADSTNLSNSNINDNSRLGRCLTPSPRSSPRQSLLILDDGVSHDHLQAILENGAELQRNAVSKSANFSKYDEKHGTGNKFSDFVEFRRYQAKKSEKKSEVGAILKSRLPAHKVVSMKEYRKSGRGRAMSVSPKKSILNKKGKTISIKALEPSPVRKQVTFSKHNTVLIFVKEDQLLNISDH